VGATFRERQAGGHIILRHTLYIYGRQCKLEITLVRLVGHTTVRMPQLQARFRTTVSRPTQFTCLGFKILEHSRNNNADNHRVDYQSARRTCDDGSIHPRRIVRAEPTLDSPRRDRTESHDYEEHEDDAEDTGFSLRLPSSHPALSPEPRRNPRRSNNGRGDIRHTSFDLGRFDPDHVGLFPRTRSRLDRDDSVADPTFDGMAHISATNILPSPQHTAIGSCSPRRSSSVEIIETRPVKRQCLGMDNYWAREDVVKSERDDSVELVSGPKRTTSRVSLGLARTAASGGPKQTLSTAHSKDPPSLQAWRTRRNPPTPSASRLNV
jgi:hypothetical protein